MLLSSFVLICLLASSAAPAPAETDPPAGLQNDCSKSQQCDNGTCSGLGSTCDTGPVLEEVADGPLSTTTEQPGQLPQEGSTALNASAPILQKNQSPPCNTPPHPENGVYLFTEIPNAYSIQLKTLCDTGFLPDYDSFVYCSYGRWSRKPPQCIRSCKFGNGHASVSYICQVGEEYRSCRNEEPSGTTVHVKCLDSQEGLPSMNCVNGTWDSFPVCTPDCGRVSSQLKNAAHGLFPWYAHMYQYYGNNYRRICGGSLISPTVVLSSARCFWNEYGKELEPFFKLAVAVGKQYGSWGDTRDRNVQRSNVSDVRIHDYYQGSATNYANDIAVVTLSTPFVYSTNVGPVCLDPYVDIEVRHLRKGAIGKAAVLVIDGDSNWNTPEIMDLPYVKREECIQKSPAEFAKYITAEKFCVHNQNIPDVCDGTTGTADRGGGVVFPDIDRGTERYYLRGVVSVYAEYPECSTFPYIASSRPTNHYNFVTSTKN